MKNYITIKKQAYYLVLLLVISLAFCFTLKAQEPLQCPEPKISKEQLARMLTYRKNAATSRTQSGTIQVRVFAHIVANNDGTLQGATPDAVLNEISIMQSDYASGDICFIYAGYNIINNTQLNSIIQDEDHPDNEDLFEPHVINSCLNIFYVDTIRGKNGASGGKIGGITFSAPNNFCVVTHGSLGKHTSSHETGHCFGLLHTFAYAEYGLENINGDDCDDLGDIICDTKADPYAYRGNPICYSQNNGFYTGFCGDPNGQTNFDPPYNNIMSYWHHDPESFTLGQTQAMDVTIVNESILNALISVSNENFSGSYSYQQTFKSARNSITTIGNCELTVVSQTALFAKKVIVNIGFHAKPDAGGYTLIKANECGFSLQSPIAKTPNVQTQTNVISNRVQPQLKVYPNPSSGKFIVEFQSSELNANNATLLFTNSTGQNLWSKKVNVINGKIKEEILTGAETKNGVYFISVIAGDKRFKSQIVIAK